jgi:integration host factor subunit beta
MTKSDLIQTIAEQMNLPVKEAKSIVDTIIETMADALAEGRSVELRGFGSFQVREYDGYTGRNPKSGEPIKVAPKKLPFFKVGKDLRDRINSAQ